MARRLAFFASFGFVTILAACGTVTGLSDDYKYDLDSGASSTADGSSGGTTDASGGDAANDGSSSGFDAGKCTQQSSSQAADDLNQHADKLSGSCDQCLASTCCNVIIQCVANQNCLSVLSCINQCQDTPSTGPNSGRAVCVENCKSGNLTGNDVVGTLTACGPTCVQSNGPCKLK